MQQNIQHQMSDVRGQKSELTSDLFPIICYHCELEKLASGQEPYLPERCKLKDCDYHQKLMSFAVSLGL